MGGIEAVASAGGIVGSTVIVVWAFVWAVRLLAFTGIGLFAALRAIKDTDKKRREIAYDVFVQTVRPWSRAPTRQDPDAGNNEARP